MWRELRDQDQEADRKWEAEREAEKKQKQSLEGEQQNGKKTEKRDTVDND